MKVLLRVVLFLVLFFPAVWAENPLHRYVVVFVPAYEGSQLSDPQLPGEPNVWGSADAIRRQELYWAIRMPNRLVAWPMRWAGPIEVYEGLMEGLTQKSNRLPAFTPYTENQDFFYFAYDWRQEMASVTAPELGRALERYAQHNATLTKRSASHVKFIIVAHSMGGLVVRTLLSQQPRLADRVERLYLVGTPNLGSVKAIKTLLVGPGGLKENPVSGWLGWLAGLLPNDVTPPVTKLVAITRPSLWELLPLEDPGWEKVDDQGRSSRVAAADVLKVSAWKRYWPSAAAERREFLEPWRARFMGGPGEPTEPNAWEFCQDDELSGLQSILSAVREWQLLLGKLSYTDRLMTRPGEISRLRLVLSVGLQTPTGLISSGQGDETEVRYLYGADGEGDGTVLAHSVMEDLQNPTQVLRLSKISHGQLVTCPPFLDHLMRDLIALEPEPLMRGTEPEMRPAEESTVP